MPCNFVDGSGSVLLAVAGVYKFVVPFGLLMNCATELEELESHDKCPEVAANREVIVDLHQLPCARLRRLAIKDCSLVPCVNTELKRVEIQKYMGYSESKLRNIRAAVCNLNFKTTPAKVARKELVRRGEWDYGGSGEEEEEEVLFHCFEAYSSCIRDALSIRAFLS